MSFRLGARLAEHLGIIPSWMMTIVRRVTALSTPLVEHVECLGLDDFAFRRGRTFGTVVADLDAHQIIDNLPDRQAETASAERGFNRRSASGAGRRPFPCVPELVRCGATAPLTAPVSGKRLPFKAIQDHNAWGY